MNILCVLFLSAVHIGQVYNEQNLGLEWRRFQSKYDKSYRSVVEYKKRMAIFEENLREYEIHNVLYERGEVSYKKGVNKFTDMTKEEFMEFVNRGMKGKRGRNKRSLVATDKNVTIPSYVNWVEKGAVTKVKDQGLCGSCYAFSAIGSLESNYKIFKGKLIPFSEKQLVDCSWNQGNYGCEGGLVSTAYEYVEKYGIESEKDYPYQDDDGHCYYDKTKVVTKIKGYVEIEEGSERDLQIAVATMGPVSVAMDATFELQGYDYGILDDKFCTTYELNHYVVVVGYGVDNGIEYYLVKNSWGEDWGDHGYFKIVRNKNNRCGIATMAVYPLM
ncbi:procathepsin L-like [Harmonia axyridis]|uniref:procathepsin L-like n=1 Tax=Harmonia axyridis TaxID=115357 RepID=UPI001E278009|nr:procathepsin L-like [Harmonia axyridis]XP_045477245.1 procathepsin L-like [Harmonia axyridis]